MTIEVDTIVARASGAGPGAIAVLRLSGPRAFEIVGRFLDRPLPEPRVATLVTLVDPASSDALDQGLLTRFVAPDSYTGEDVVEFSGHGGSFVPALLLDAFVAAGCRAAEPGEFTRRAFAHGKIDLLQAEAIDDLIHGRSRAAHRTAVTQLDRGLSVRVSEHRRGLVDLEALLVHHIDFPEEDDAPAGVAEISRRARTLASAIDRLAGTASEGILLRRGAEVVLAGAPNAGKSSLFNALAGEDRALVTEIAGTTRDAIEVEVELGGFPFRLVDTAGLRDSGERIERLGIEVAERRLESADVVLLCVDGSSGRDGSERASAEAIRGRTPAPIVRVRTKADLSADPDGEGSRAGFAFAGECAVSVVTGDGLAALRDLLPRLVFAGLVQSDDAAPVLTRRRHLEGARVAVDEIGAFADALDAGVPPEVASTHLKSAATALEGLLGVVEREEILDALFDSFCIGK